MFMKMMLPDFDHWSREPITTLSAPSMFMSRFIRTDYHAGQIFIPLWRTPPERRLLACRRRLQPRLFDWSRLSHCLVYFHHRMAVLDFYRVTVSVRGDLRWVTSLRKVALHSSISDPTLPLPRSPDGQRPERMAYISKQGLILTGKSLPLLFTFLATGFILFSTCTERRLPFYIS